MEQFIEVLLPAFVLGMVMKTVHHSQGEERASSFISYLFMFLVVEYLSLSVWRLGRRCPDGDADLPCNCGNDSFESWEMFPLFFYRDRRFRSVWLRSVFTRRSRAGIIVTPMGYQLGGPALIISILSLVLNLV